MNATTNSKEATMTTVASTGRRYRVVGVVSDYKRHGVLEAPAPFA